MKLEHLKISLDCKQSQLTALLLAIATQSLITIYSDTNTDIEKSDYNVLTKTVQYAENLQRLDVRNTKLHQSLVVKTV